MVENKAKELDQWYTPADTVEIIIDFLKNKNILNANVSKIIEPSAGTGSFYFPLKKLGLNVEAYDIDPKFYECIEQDFFKLNKDKHEEVIIIGNPPYGRKGKLAQEFINKGLTIANHVCFIVPLTLTASYTAQKHIHGHLLYEIDIPHEFIFNNKITKVKSKFQVWSNFNENDIRLKKPQTKIDDFESRIYNKTKTSRKWLDWDWDIAIKRNSKKGEFITEGPASPDFHWILLKSKTDTVLKKLLQIDFSKINDNKMTAGMGKADMIKAYLELE